jgi:transposase
VLFDVSALYFETDAGNGFREPGLSKERRLAPQITIGLLTDAAGFPLMVEAFEGNRGETSTMPLRSRRSWPPTSCPTSRSSRTRG